MAGLHGVSKKTSAFFSWGLVAKPTIIYYHQAANLKRQSATVTVLPNAALLHYRYGLYDVSDHVSCLIDMSIRPRVWPGQARPGQGPCQSGRGLTVASTDDVGNVMDVKCVDEEGLHSMTDCAEGRRPQRWRCKSREREGGRGTAWAKMKWGREDE